MDVQILLLVLISVHILSSWSFVLQPQRISRRCASTTFHYKFEEDSQREQEERETNIVEGDQKENKKKKGRVRKELIECNDSLKLRELLCSNPNAKKEGGVKELSQFSVKEDVVDLESALKDHAVIDLIANRYRESSKPYNRTDGAHLALSIEGGGMRGSVSAGMTGAIAVLGLLDCFDSVYGSSAGSVVGSYAISRQMCVDVYTKLLPNNRQFVRKNKIIRGAAKSWMGMRKYKSSTPPPPPSTPSSSPMVQFISVNDTASTNADPTPPEPDPSPSSSDSDNPISIEIEAAPGMNISYVLEGIMSKSGLRPFDFPTFIHNLPYQSLNVISSTSDFSTAVFSDANGDFFSKYSEDSGIINPTVSVNNDWRGMGSGFFTCLAASMVVPGVGGSPLHLKRPSEEEDKLYFDAFVFEPIPYRSAVYSKTHDPATHVLALRTRPNCAPLVTVPGIYEKYIGPYFFNENGMEDVADWYKKGGQQYIYIEDILTTTSGLKSPDKKIPIPPPEVVYKRDGFEGTKIENWREAHLASIMLPSSIPETSALEQRPEAVIESVRDGFVTAYDALVGVTGVSIHKDWTSRRLAEIIFPIEEGGKEGNEKLKKAQATKIRVEGNKITTKDLYQNPFLVKQHSKRGRLKSLLSRRYRQKELLLSKRNSSKAFDPVLEEVLGMLPGVTDGLFSHLTLEIRSRLNATVDENDERRR